jgi:hypothetical protein
MQHIVTVQRNTTTVSPSGSGATQFNYAPLLSGGVPVTLKCSLQEANGRLEQVDVGQEPNRIKSGIFGNEAASVLQQNDLIVLVNVNPGQTYRVTHIHVVPDANAPHVEVKVEQWKPGGGD